MIRDVARLTSRPFDVLIVGGGIHGLTIAYDAAQRGLSVALIERGDFGSGASFNHLRTIHGGLRYLQTFDVRRAHASVGERRALARIAPHALRPLPFALPLYRSVLKGRLAMRLGFLLDRLVAFNRNVDVPHALRLPGGRVTSRAEAIERFPGLSRRGLTGAAVWHDYTLPEADRLTLAWAIGAAEHGAVLANYVEAMGPILKDRRVVGVRGIDRDTGREVEVSATVTVSASGGLFERLLPARADRHPPTLVAAMNLVTRRDAGDEALGGRSASGRHLFLVPCRNRAIFGTWESSVACLPDQPPRPTDTDVDSFIAELNQAFPSLDLTRDDVTLVHYGTVPATVTSRQHVTPSPHESIDDSVSGLLSVTGTKYTTARAVAERVTDRLTTTIKGRAVPCRSGSVPLPGGSLRDVASAIADARRLHDGGLPSDTIPHLITAYGSRYEPLVALASERAEWRARVAVDCPVVGAELVWAVRHEMAIRLSDAVIRRTPLGAMGYPGDAAVQRAAAIVAGELQWSEDRQRAEIDDVKGFYSV